MKLTELFLNRFLYRDSVQTLETPDSTLTSLNSSGEVAPSIASGGAAQDINTGNVTINGGQLTPGTYPTTVLDVSNWGWGQTLVFSPSTIDTVIWTASVGHNTFKSADGTTYTISSGTTGAMTLKTYIYLDLLTSTTAYQITTIPANSVGVGKVLIAVAEKSAVVGTLATYNLSEASQIVGDNILANTINASKITTGQLIVGTNVGLGTAQDSGGVTTIIGNTVTTGFVNALSVTAGSVAAENITGTTITGKVIQTTSTGLRIVLGPSSLTDRIQWMNNSTVYASIFPSGGGTQTGISAETITAESYWYITEGTHSTAGMGTVGASIDLYDNTVDISGTFTVNGSPIGGGNQTPWTSNIDAAGYDLTGLGKFKLPVGTNLY